MRARDFGLERGFPTTPDMLVALVSYRTELTMEAVRHQLQTGERIPARALRAQVCEELGLDDAELEMMSYAGEMVRWERELSVLSEEERAARLEEFAAAQREIDETAFDATVQTTRSAEAETELLKRMFEDGA